MATRYPREQMHRIKYTKLTPEQILGKLSSVTGPTISAGGTRCPTTSDT